jgi:hypothetical protein
MLGNHVLVLVHVLLLLEHEIHNLLPVTIIVAAAVDWVKLKT